MRFAVVLDVQSRSRRACFGPQCALGVSIVLILLALAAPVCSGEGDGTTVEMYKGLERSVITFGKKNEGATPTLAPGEIFSASHTTLSKTFEPSTFPRRVRVRFPFILAPQVGLTGAGDPLAFFKKQELPPGLAPAPVALARIADKPVTIAQWFGHVQRPAADHPQELVRHENRQGRTWDLSEAQEQSGKTDHAAAQAKPSPSERHASIIEHDFFSSTLLFYAALIVAVAVIAPLVSFACFFWLLGRHGRRFDPLPTQPIPLAEARVIGPMVVSAPELERPLLPVTEETQKTEPEPIVLARLKNYQNLRAKHAQEHREAILAQLLHDNLELFKEIRTRKNSHDEDLIEE